MRVLLIGSGGREHALAWKIAKSPMVTGLFAAPGNPGIGEYAKLFDVKVTDVAGLLALAKEIHADLVIIGPESSLEVGLSDALREQGIACFGPSRLAARLETSKGFTKAFAARHNIPTAAYEFHNNKAEALAALKRFSPPYVLKADGLAAGKGVIIAANKTEAEDAITRILDGVDLPDTAGKGLVIEEFMEGEEASVFALCDGHEAVIFGNARDHKRLNDGDKGPNTGGMGTYSPTPLITKAISDQILEQIIKPTLRGMAEEGYPYQGVLYAGLMLTKNGPKLVEYNARFGDPECQVLMLRLQSDLVPYLQACALGDIRGLPPLEWHNDAALCVVLAARGYPLSPVTGGLIKNVEGVDFKDAQIFHAGTGKDETGRLVVKGGRVLNVCALGVDLVAARARAYEAIAKIDWSEGIYRKDIGLVSHNPETGP